ncbi:MAG: hypothetical protein HY747_04340 [Elusimicrobia bacterium]|nr:hypothetical protein [Elusimicrobiota bacterium]
MFDPVIIFCGLLCLCALAVAYWSVERFIRIKRLSPQANLVSGFAGEASAAAGPLPECPAVETGPSGGNSAALEAQAKAVVPASAAPSADNLNAEIQKLGETVRSLELTHVEALKILGERLDKIESDLKSLSLEWEPRIENVEKSLAVKISKQSLEPQQPAVKQPSPPPFV